MKTEITRRYLEFFKFGELEINQILENQEDSERLRSFADENAMLLMRVEKAEMILNHLKILIKDFEGDVSAKDVCKEIQKILKEKN